MSSGDESITRLLQDVKAGDSLAAQHVWQQYYHRLIGLARRRLGEVARREADEEDVVVTAFNSFYRGAAEGRFPRLEDRNDLWQILVMLTARKAANQRAHQRRLKRGGGGVRGESVFQSGADEPNPGIDAVVGAEPSPEFADQVVNQCEELLGRLDDPTLRQVAVAKMEGYTNDEIAERLEVKTRTVERKLRLIREIWSDSVSGDGDGR